MDLTIPSFILKITFDTTTYSFQVSQTFLSETREVFNLACENKIIEIQSNRPLIRGKGLNKKKIEWKAINGKVKYVSSLEKIIVELESYIKKIEKTPFNWDDHPKNRPY